MRSQKQLQVGEQIKRTISDIFLREGLLALDSGLITILEVQVTRDLKDAKIYFDAFGAKDPKQIEDELNRMTPNFRFKLSQKMKLRVMPEIRFILDTTSEKAVKLEALIDEEAKHFPK